MSENPRVVVVGAGVSGLTTALVLAQTGNYDVAVIAKHMPGDYDISYASPWAGANYLPVSRAGSKDEKYDRDTWEILERLTREVPEAGIHFQDELRPFNHPKRQLGETAITSWMAEMLSPDGPWYKDMLPNFHRLTPSEAHPYDDGIRFTAVCINVSIYLPWLLGQLLRHSVSLRRATLTHINEAAHAHPSGKPAQIVINCTALSSLTLPGIEDKSMYPVRGQIAHVRNEPGVMMSTVVSDGPEDELCYIMQRAAGGGTAIGGCYQVGSWNAAVDHNMATRIMQRAVKACPELTDEKSLPVGEKWKAGKGVEALDVIQHWVGLRPCRKDGIRIEAEKRDGYVLIHNIGHGGTGYQSSWGCAKAAAELVKENV